jgi:hypothetical protein
MEYLELKRLPILRQAAGCLRQIRHLPVAAPHHISSHSLPYAPISSK